MLDDAQKRKTADTQAEDRAKAHFDGAWERAHKEPDIAFRMLISGVSMYPDYPDGWYKLGVALHDQRHHTQAIVAYHKALYCMGRWQESHSGKRHPFLGKTLSNIGWNLHLDGRSKEAVVWSEKAIYVEPDLDIAWNNLSQIRLALDDVDAAARAAMRAHLLKPDADMNRLALAFVQLFDSQFIEGFDNYQARIPTRIPEMMKYPFPVWDGSAVDTLLIQSEQGMGDAINMARFFPAVADRVREKLWIYAHPATGVLFRNSIPESMVEKTEIVLGPMPLPAQVDAFIPTMSIPVALKVTAEQVRSHPEPYLFARQPLTLPADGQADVGIVWAGGTAHDADRYRSAKLADFLPLGEVPGVRLHSLQVGDRSRDLILQRGHGMVRDWSSEIATLHDTANIIAGLDLVITVDTAVAHLAGAMGHPVWTLVSQQALDYRWLRKGDRTIWYPSMRLFRQPLRTSWSDLILNEVKPALMELVGARE